ncbi:MAG: glycosyltransferase family 4 protein [Ideonella sp.]|nr:glycosyltransferase family 4 protein [Ideonella sp.]MCC7459363.1 glycosyltransferase family 4 protein [Nitrospira sp.]
MKLASAEVLTIERAAAARQPEMSSKSGLRQDRLPHVCFVSMGLYPILNAAANVESAGGAEVQQTILARMLKAAGYPVSVLTGNYGQPDVEEIGGIRVYRVPSDEGRGIRGLRFLYPILTDVVSALRRVDPDIVYYRIAGFRSMAAAWYARKYRKRFVYACASDREFLSRAETGLSRRDEFLFRSAVRMADGVLVQNIAQKDLLRSRLGRDGELIQNCYDESGVTPASSGGPVIWVGGFRPLKRPELFIELARRLPARRFVMVGGADSDNDPGQEFYRRMRDLAADVGNMEFVGFVPFSEVGRYFDAASALVNTSDREGFPNTFLQAWIRGVPTLSFVNPQTIPGRTGTIVCRDLDELAARLETMLAEPGRWGAASQACKAYFDQNHSQVAVLGRYRDCFHRLRAGR